MDQTYQFARNNSGWISTILFIVVCIVILYVVYTYLYPADDPNYTQFLTDEMDARKPIPIKGKVPPIFTGGDFTLSMWVYIDDWNYRVSTSKFLFAISPANVALTTVSPIVGVLTPLQNGLQVRANVVSPGSGSSPVEAATPDITKESNLQNLLNQQTSIQMFSSTVADVPCDIKEVPLQKWVNITIVSSGRVLDIYMDGKLSRSCVLDSVIKVPAGDLKLRLGESGGFGGRYSSVQMWSQQLTPDLIYGIYQMGPSQTKHDLYTDIARWLGISVNFTGISSGTAPEQAACTGGPSMLSSLENTYQLGGLGAVFYQGGQTLQGAASTTYNFAANM
jgi:hypothetical protein